MQRFKWIIIGLACLITVYWMISPFINVFVYSIFVYYTTRPLYSRLNKKFKSKTVAAYASIILVVLPITVVLLYTVGVASIELLNLVRTLELPYARIAKLISEYSTVVYSLSWREIADIVRENPDFKQVVDITLGLVTSTLGLVFKLILVFIISYLFLRDGPVFKSWLVENVFHRDKQLAESFMNGVDRDLQNVFYGNILTALIIAFIAVVLFSILNSISPGVKIPYTVLLGILCGFTSLIPGVGVAIVWAPVTVLLGVQAYLKGALIEQLWFVALFMVTTFLAADFLPNYTIRPKVSGKTVNEDLMLLAYIFGPLTFGLSGILIGPIVLVVTINFIKIVLPELKLL
jgi:predicted PurR-regulated permease PerM